MNPNIDQWRVQLRLKANERVTIMKLLCFIMILVVVPTVIYTQDWDGNCGAIGDACDFFMQCCVPHKCLKMEHGNGNEHICYKTTD